MYLSREFSPTISFVTSSTGLDEEVRQLLKIPECEL